MDLQYCDQCGSILQNRLTDPAKPGAVVICEVCKTSPIGEPPASAVAAAETTVRDPSSPGVKITLKESASTMAPTATIQGEDLTLFSTETIARRKTQLQADEAQQAKPRIKIVEGQGEH